MSRILFSYLNQTTYDSLAVLLRNLQWPSVTSLPYRAPDAKKLQGSGANRDLDDQPGFITRILENNASRIEVLQPQLNPPPRFVRLAHPLLFPEAYVGGLSVKHPLLEAVKPVKGEDVPKVVGERAFPSKPFVEESRTILTKRSKRHTGGHHGHHGKGKKKKHDKAKVSASITSAIAGVVGALDDALPTFQAAPIVEETPSTHAVADKDTHGEDAAISEVSPKPLSNEDAKETSSGMNSSSDSEVDAEKTAVNVDEIQEEGKHEATVNAGKVEIEVTDKSDEACERDSKEKEKDLNIDQGSEATAPSMSASSKDPLRCTHSTKHVCLSKCSSALKKKTTSIEGDWLLCLQCGRPWSNEAAAETHASRSNHPVMLKCLDGTMVCFKCDHLDVTKSLAAQSEPTLSDTERIRELLKVKLGSSSCSTSSSFSTTSKPVSVLSEEKKWEESKEEDVSGTSGAPLGLKNLGNTCFFNSSLQVLAHSQRVQDALKEPSTVGSLANALGKCLREVKRITPSSTSTTVERKGKRSGGGGGQVVSPAPLFSAVCKVAPHFSGFEQQDAQELMTFLLGGIDDEANVRNGVGAAEGPRSSTSTFDDHPSEETTTKKRLPAIMGKDWKVKHAEFWFGSKASSVVARTRPDEDDEPGALIPYSDEDDEAEEEEDEESREYDFANDARGEDDEAKKPLDVVEQKTEDVIIIKKEQTAAAAVEEKTQDEEERIKSSVNLTKDVFQIDLESIVQCDDCNSETIRKESQYMLSLAIGELPSTSNNNSSGNKKNEIGKGVKGGRSSGKTQGAGSASIASKPEPLSACLNRFFSPERLLVADGNGFQCDKCARRKGQKAEQSPAHDATRKMRLAHVRDVLILHLKRFHQVERAGGKGGARAVKIETHVQLDSVLELPFGQGEMHLVGVVEHLGKSLHGGHYVAYVQSGPGTWFRCSDDVVTKVSESHVMDSVQAYLALYERR